MSEEPPSLPQRPKSPFTTQIQELQDAFPDADANVRRAILVAAGGNLENAFNGLLALSDDTIRPPPPQEEIISREQQLRNDEELARRIAQGPRRSREQQFQQQQSRGGAEYREGQERDQDDISIDEIRDNIQKWGNEASKNIGSFFNNLKTRIQTEFQQEEPDEDYYGRVDPLNRGTSRADAYRQVQTSRRSDSPHFIEMNEDQPPAPPPKPTRPGAGGDKQKVNVFGEDKPARWEPLRSTAESDAFFIGESDEEVDSLDEDTPLASRGDSKASEAKADTTSKKTDGEKTGSTSDIKAEDKDAKVTKPAKPAAKEPEAKDKTEETKESKNNSESSTTKEASKDSKSAKEAKDESKDDKTKSDSKDSKDDETKSDSK